MLLLGSWTVHLLLAVSVFTFSVNPMNALIEQVLQTCNPRSFGHVPSYEEWNNHLCLYRKSWDWTMIGRKHRVRWWRIDIWRAWSFLEIPWMSCGYAFINGVFVKKWNCWLLESFIARVSRECFWRGCINELIMYNKINFMYCHCLLYLFIFSKLLLSSQLIYRP